jgi:type I restriction enzyme S subunit
MAGDDRIGTLDSWKTRRLDEVATIIDSLHKTPAYSEQGLPMVRVTDIKGGFLDLSGTLKVADDVFVEFTRRHRPQRGDIVFSRVGTYGNASYVAGDAPFCLGQNTALIHPSINSRFLHYCLQSPAVREQIEHSVVGSTQKTISLKSISALQIPVPPDPELEAIAHILGTLDDKIELNRRMNETLAAMARALFKSWFVDFDPVRAKAERRDPGLPKPLANLFPDSFEDSELGEIPKGWGRKTVMQVCKTVTRGVTPKYEDGSGRFIINQRVNRGVHLDWSALKELSSTLEVPTDCYAKRWDVLVNCLGEGTLGRTHLFMYRSDIYAVDQHMSICRGSTHGAGAYLYQVLSSPSGQEKIESSKTGSTGMTMFNISKLRNFDFLWPGGDLVNEYFQVVEPAWLRVVSNEEESRTLSTLRDTLLLRLISGELRIEAAEQILNRVT